MNILVFFEIRSKTRKVEKLEHFTNAFSFIYSQNLYDFDGFDKVRLNAIN